MQGCGVGWHGWLAQAIAWHLAAVRCARSLRVVVVVSSVVFWSSCPTFDAEIPRPAYVYDISLAK